MFSSQKNQRVCFDKKTNLAYLLPDVKNIFYIIIVTYMHIPHASLAINQICL